MKQANKLGYARFVNTMVCLMNTGTASVPSVEDKKGELALEYEQANAWIVGKNSTPVRVSLKVGSDVHTETVTADWAFLEPDPRQQASEEAATLKSRGKNVVAAVKGLGAEAMFQAHLGTARQLQREEVMAQAAHVVERLLRKYLDLT